MSVEVGLPSHDHETFLSTLLCLQVKKALEDVAALREQKKGLQHDIAELMSFKAKNLNGAPDMVRSCEGDELEYN